MNDLDRAINILGGVNSFARAINIKPPSINSWRGSKNGVPIIRCVQIEKATDGQVTRKDLRPNDYHMIWPELAERQSDE